MKKVAKGAFVVAMSLVPISIAAIMLGCMVACIARDTLGWDAGSAYRAGDQAATVLGCLGAGYAIGVAVMND